MVVRLIHYGVIALLVGAAIVYWLYKPPTLNPMSDARAAEALALVQTHRAQSAPTILQAISREVGDMTQRGRKVRVGDWTVQKQAGDTKDRVYVVRLEVREEGSTGWIEREYLWQVDVVNKRIFPVSVPATFMMPIAAEASAR